MFIPLAGGVITRNYITKKAGLDYFEKSFYTESLEYHHHRFITDFSNNLFISEGDYILKYPLHIVFNRYTINYSDLPYLFHRLPGKQSSEVPHDIAAPAGMIGGLQFFFELAVVLRFALFGTQSPAALATIVGVLTEVPVMLILVKIANNTKHWFPVKS